MSRVYKFRAWNKKEKVMCGIPEGRINYVIQNPHRYELMQFTGLQDKKGVDVYEGDIVECHFWEWDRKMQQRMKYHNRGYVEYMKLKAGFMLHVDDEHFIDLRLGEILGNVHENPELLKEEKCPA